MTDTGSSENYGLHARTYSSAGRAVFGWSLSSAGGTGVWGQTNAGAGAAVRGYAWDGDGTSGHFGTGVIGTSGSHAFPPPAGRANTGVMGVSPTGTGGYFASTSGRGGIFKGGAAQLRLVASSSVTHPGSGQVGDLFVDKSKRLWFCKGGTTWKQLA